MTYFEKLMALLRSRRFQLAAVGALEVAFHDVLGLTVTEAATIAGLIGTWIFGDTMRKTE